MTDIEAKALALVNEVLTDRGEFLCEFIDREEHEADEALCRAIEAHEADKARHAAELRAENARLKEALEHACEVIESCNATFLHKWGTTNKWRDGVLAAARAAIGEPQ